MWAFFAPKRRAFSPTRLSSDSRRADRISSAPSFAKASASASPMPEEAPVIHTTLPSNRLVIGAV
jgi:hypothetical protein